MPDVDLARLSAAAVLLLGLAGCSGPGDAVNGGAAPPPTRTPTEAPTRTPPRSDGSIYFAADTSAGDALTDPTEFGEIEVHPQPMDIYLSRRGEPVRRVVATNAHERCPAVSPNGDRIAYLEGTTIAIAPLGADGTPGAPAVRVDLKAEGLYALYPYRYGNHAGIACPQWSPDGRRLGYEVTLGEPRTTVYDPLTAEIHAVALDGEDRVLASFDTKVWHTEPDFAWSPDGDEVAYGTVEGVWRAPIDGGGRELVWRAPGGGPSAVRTFDDDRPISLAWSSRGEIAFTVRGFVPTDPDDPMSGGRETFTLVVVDARSGRTLLETPENETEGSGGELWSPDGSLLAFNGPGGRILLNDRASGSTVRLRPRIGGGAGVDFTARTWSPDGRELLVGARDDDRGFALVSVAADGSSSKIRTPWTWALDWASLDDVDWSAPGGGGTT